MQDWNLWRYSTQLHLTENINAGEFHDKQEDCLPQTVMQTCGRSYALSMEQPSNISSALATRIDEKTWYIIHFNNDTMHVTANLHDWT